MTQEMDKKEIDKALANLTDASLVELSDMDMVEDKEPLDDDLNQQETSFNRTSCENCVQSIIVPILTCNCNAFASFDYNHCKNSCSNCCADCWHGAVATWRSFDAKLIWGACQRARTKWPGSTWALVVALLILACLALFSRAPTVGGNEEAARELTHVIVWVAILVFVSSSAMTCFLFFCCYEYSSTFSGTDSRGPASDYVDDDLRGLGSMDIPPYNARGEIQEPTWK